MERARERYRNDPVFHAVVNYVRVWIRDHQLAPSELREAVLLAAYIEEIENPTPAAYRTAAFAADLRAELDAAVGMWLHLPGYKMRPGERCTRGMHDHVRGPLGHFWTSEREAAWARGEFGPMRRCEYVEPVVVPG